MFVDLSRLVVLSLDNRRASHDSLGCCNKDEVLAGDAQENIPGKRDWLDPGIQHDQKRQSGTYMSAVKDNQG